MGKEEEIQELIQHYKSEFSRIPLTNTPQFDPRFPNQNQSRNCYQNYLDFHRCRKAKGEDYEPCNYYKRAYMELCPSVFHERWDSQIERGVFAGRI